LIGRRLQHVRLGLFGPVQHKDALIEMLFMPVTLFSLRPVSSGFLELLALLADDVLELKSAEQSARAGFTDPPT